ncbi:hypothetical protein VTN00DRAFT_115 [Thermoascus crustaceus]|uniref:uncharacterized protein n=1 Tax=Thermoascus crustaceus TaxID=5088 RepID=UPI003742C3AB
MASTGVGLPNNAALISTTGHDKAGPRGTWLIVAGRKRLRDLGKQQGRSGGRGAHVGRRAEPREEGALARRVSNVPPDIGLRQPFPRWDSPSTPPPRRRISSRHCYPAMRNAAIWSPARPPSSAMGLTGEIAGIVDDAPPAASALLFCCLVPWLRSPEGWRVPGTAASLIQKALTSRA